MPGNEASWQAIPGHSVNFRDRRTISGTILGIPGIPGRLASTRLLLLSVIRPSIEYGSEVWEGNKSQAGSLESIILDGAKRILGCSSKTCNEAVRGDMGLDTLQCHRDRAKLKWWYKLATLPEDRYPKQLFNQEWNIKPQRKAEEIVE